MPAKLDLLKQVFGQLTVVESSANKGKDSAWVCLCTCGQTVTVRSDHLKRGATVSCGCARGTHRLYRHKLYPTWNLMLSRCYNSKHTYYHRYGGRGIQVHKEWHDCETFILEITKLLGDKPEGYQLDRIENDEDYRPGNVKWSTRIENGRNKSNTQIVEYQGKLMSLPEAAELSGINYHTLCGRIRRGYNNEKLFEAVK